jgi:hypothetical protein
MQSYCIARRSLTTIDLYEGRINLLELAVLNVLRDRADIATGGWKINATALVTFCGGSLSLDQADRSLRSLEQKKYIKRWPSRRHEVYPYLINGYFITHGVNKGQYLNTDKTTDWKSPVYEAEAPETAESHPQTHPQADPDNLLHPQTHPQVVPQGVPQETRISGPFSADKYIKRIKNDKEEGISNTIYRDGGTSNHQFTSVQDRESQKQPPHVPAAASAPADNLSDSSTPNLSTPSLSTPDLSTPHVSAADSAPADNLSTPDPKYPTPDQLATVLLISLGSPKRFNNPETLSRWAGLMESLLAETELRFTELNEFITWSVISNFNENFKLSSAEFIPKSKDPCQTLCKHSMGSNPWLFQMWDSLQKVAQKKAAAIAKATAKADASEFNKGGVSSFDTYMAKLRAAKEAQYKYPEGNTENNDI